MQACGGVCLRVYVGIAYVRIVELFLAHQHCRAEAGAVGVQQMLTLSPCDLFKLLEGRTLWLLGDSITQAS